MLAQRGLRRFLVNGSGDIRYVGTEPVLCGLEHPVDKTKVIGSLRIASGALCASGTDRRSWDGRNHVLDPITFTSPTEIVATWVLSDHAALSDALATCLFFVDPESLAQQFHFEYCILNRDMRVQYSSDFSAEWY
jgi:thiamine biosynthesis lipoprotein